MGQLTQALVYTSAGTARSDAGPLWMRTISIRIDDPPRILPTQFESITRMRRDRVLQRDGHRLHDVVVESSATSGVTALSKLAYEEMDHGR